MRKKLLYIFLNIFMLNVMVLASPDYQKLYEKTEPVKFTFFRDIDPFQNEDYFRYSYCPYPLYRTSITLYFKNTVIEPQYYILTPRNYQNRDIVLFKVMGKVKYIIPAVKTELVPLGFYETHLPKRKLTKWQSFKEAFSETFYKIFKSSKKEPGPQSFIVTERLDNNYVQIKLYYGDKIYYLVFSLLKN